MKSKITVAFSVLLILFLSYSCEKDNSPEAADITGTWYWIESMIVYPAEPQTPQNTGITEIIEFRPDRNWTKLQNNIRTDYGTYSTGHGSTTHAGVYVYVYDSVVYRNRSLEVLSTDYYKVFNDTLQFSSGFAGMCGGVTRLYVRKK